MSTSRPSSHVSALKVALGVAMACALGLHWLILQGVAWTTMIVSFSAQGTLGEAFEKTFDGDHPCPLCEAVQRGSQSDREAPEPATAKALKFIELRFSRVRIFPPAPSRSRIVETDSTLRDADHKPEPPPPKGRLA